MLRQKSKGKLNLNKSFTLDPQEYTLPLHQEYLEVPTEQQQKSSNKTQQNMHQFILSEFKIKYDQLKNQYQVKKKEADTLLYEKKKLQIQLLNHNVQYYQRQLIRLRSEVEKYQTENEENKHRFLMAENAKKDLEATSKVKQEELKQVLKQFEKEKITVVQLRHQLNEKDRNFSNILEGVQTTNHQLSQKYDQTNQKLSKLQSDFKVKNIEVEQLKRQLQRKQKQLNLKSDQYQKQKQKHELQQYRLKNQLNDLQEDIKQYKGKQNEEINKLKQQVQQLKSQRASEQLLLLKKTQQAKQTRDLNVKQAQIARLEHKLRELQFIAEQRNEKIKVLQQKLRGVCSIELLQQTQHKYNQLLTKQGAMEKHMSARICELERQLELTKMRNSSQFETIMPNNFQQLLKVQIQQNSKLKAELSSKIDQVFALKSKIEEQQIRQSLYQNEIEILKKKQKAEQKNSKIGFEIEIQNLKNQIQTLRRKVEITETKLNIKMKEVKDKDAFITSVIIGRSRQEDVPFVIAQLQRIFEGEYIIKLNEANTKIANLQKKLQNSL